MMKILWLFLLITAWAVHSVQAQPNKAAMRKLSPVLQQRIGSFPQNQLQTFWIVSGNTDSLKNFLAQDQWPVQVIGEHAGGLLVIKTSFRTVDSLQTRSSLVRFVDIPRRPKEEQALPSFDNSLNALNQVQHYYPAINGNNLVVSVKENKPDSTDIDFTGRWLATPLGSPTISSHATIMATIIAGGGNSFYTAKGAAPAATISNSDFASLLPDAENQYDQYNIAVQNHSYGTGIENYYGADAVAYDAITNNNRQLVHVFSAGNSGTATGAGGAYAGIAGMANITGSFKMAKNIITVAATDSFGNVSLLSSKGPAYDGRIKPELAAFGQDGSSGAAALTSGTVLLLQQAFKEQHSSALPPAALVKAILLNSANDTGMPGPDFQSGYGNLDAYKAMQTLQAGHYAEGTVSQGGLYTFSIPVGANTRQLKITLCWNDPAAPANASKALMNDLDLELVNNSTTWQPWVLNTKPVKDSLLLPAVRGNDTLNNVEQITVDDPSAGAYSIRVKGTALKAGNSQSFYIAWQQDTAGRYQWQYPLSTDRLVGGKPNIIRWSSTINTNSGQLQYSVDKGLSWRLINNGVLPDNRYYYWPVPDTFCTALLRMTIDGQVYTSDTFTISKPLSVNVGFNCSDSMMLFWNRVPSLSAYTVYRLNANYMQPVAIITDTSIIVRNPGTHWYSVEPVIDSKSGIRAYTIDYTLQGVGCYLKNFLVDLVNQNSARLLIEIGTTYNIRSITAEKLNRDQYQPLQTITPVTELQYAITDNALHHGANTYRLRIELQNGAVIYSDPQTIYNFIDSHYLVFPNPTKAGGYVQVVTEDPDQVQLMLFNTLGQKVLERKLSETTEQIPLHGLKSGVYFILILKKGKKDFTAPLMIQ